MSGRQNDGRPKGSRLILWGGTAALAVLAGIIGPLVVTQTFPRTEFPSLLYLYVHALWIYIWPAGIMMIAGKELLALSVISNIFIFFIFSFTMMPIINRPWGVAIAFVAVIIYLAFASTLFFPGPLAGLPALATATVFYGLLLYGLHRIRRRTSAAPPPADG